MVKALSPGYNEKGFRMTEWDQMIFNRMTIKGMSTVRIRLMLGMLIFDHLEILDEVIRDLTKWVKDGTISTEACETVVQARFEEVPTVYQKLFSGANQGKLITEVIQ
jgi:NADPH-dependent curcumin reductase CurA